MLAMMVVWTLAGLGLTTVLEMALTRQKLSAGSASCCVSW